MLAIAGHPDPSFEESAEVVDARRRARLLAVSDLPIVIQGEPGTGRRTLAASVVQERSGQSGRPVAAFDGIHGIPADFTSRFQSGNVSRAEVLVHNLEALSPRGLAELASLVHAKLIRLVAVVGHRERDEADHAEVRGRAIDLDTEVGATRVLLPPIRDRGDDVTRWAQFFLGGTSQRLSLPVPELASGALNALRQHRWPGNLIELDAVLSRALCLSASQKLEATDLGLTEAESPIQALADATEQFRKSYIDRALAHYSGNRSKAARALGVDVRTIFRHLEKK